HLRLDALPSESFCLTGAPLGLSRKVQEEESREQERELLQRVHDIRPDSLRAGITSHTRSIRYERHSCRRTRGFASGDRIRVPVHGGRTAAYEPSASRI